MPLSIVSTPLSTPRTALADAQAALAKAKAALPTFAESVARLERAKADEAAALSDMQDFEAAKVAAVKAWASSGAPGEPPAADDKRRTELKRTLEAAAARAETARRAEAALERENAAALVRVSSAKDKLSRAVSAVVIAELQISAADLADATRKHERAVLTHFMAIGNAAGLIAHDDRPALRVMELDCEVMLDGKRLNFPTVAEFAAAAKPLKQFADRLHDDAAAQMEN